MAELLALHRESDIRERLGRLPASLKAAYDEIYERVQQQPGSSQILAIRAFQWVMCSTVPLTPTKLDAVVCQDASTD